MIDEEGGQCIAIGKESNKRAKKFEKKTAAGQIVFAEQVTLS